MRWAFVHLLIALACAGCGSTGRLIETKTAVAAFRQAGFRDLEVLSNRKACEQLAHEAHDPSRVRSALNDDTIIIRGVGNPLLEPLLAVRFSTVKDAKQRLANDQPLLHDALSAQERSLLPHGYSVSHLRDVRVCNLVVASYNASNQAALNTRFDRAIELLNHFQRQGLPSIR